MFQDRLAWFPTTGRDHVSALLVLGTLVLGVVGVAEWLDHARRLAELPHGSILLGLRGVALSGVLGTLAIAWHKRATLLSGESGAIGFALRGLGTGVLLGWAAGSAAHVLLAGDRLTLSSAFWSACITFVALWTGFALLAPGRCFSPRQRWIDSVLWNLLLGVVLAELVINLWALANPSPFLWDEGSVTASIEARRLAPGAWHLGSRANSGGYYDDEFQPPRDDELVIAVLADSFGVGIVPHAYNFTTVAERSLAELLPGQEVALHNYGVSGVGMPEYAWLLEREVPRSSPQLVLLCVFVGNDIQSFTRTRGKYYSFHRFVVFELLRRFGAAGDVAKGGVLDAQHLAQEAAPSIPEPGEEVPTFDAERFLKIEHGRMEVTDTSGEDVEGLYQRFFGALAAIHRSAGLRLRVVLIPDEFQVNDGLWQQLLDREEKQDEAFVRDLPQQRVLAFCAEHDLPCLDLLPTLRAAHAAQPAYHPRDTHWNARGNRIGGEAIARFLAQTLPR